MKKLINLCAILVFVNTVQSKNISAFFSYCTFDVPGKTPYVEFGNNSLFVFIRSGQHAGEIVRVANAPVDAEFTGPCFSPDYKTLFLSVQHPGEESKSKENPTSHWPDGEIPKPSVVTLSGSFLDMIVEGKV